MQAEGSKGQIIYDQESAFGATPGTVSAFLLPFLSETLSAKKTLHRSNVIRSKRDLTKPVRGNIDVSGAIKTELNPYMGILLKHLLGAVTTTGTGPYVHTIKSGTLPVSLCIEKGFTDLGQYFLFNGCRINKGSFEFNPDGLIGFDIDFVGASRSVSATSIDATPTDLGHLPFDGFEASIEEGGASIAYVQKVSFDLDNDLDNANYVIGGAGKRRAIPAGKSTVTGTLTALFESMTLYTKAIQFTETSLKITMTRGTGLGSAGNESLEILLPEIVFEEKDPVISGPKGVLVELPFTAYYDNATEAASIQMTLKNTQATL